MFRIVMFRLLALAVALLTAGCAKQNHPPNLPTWIIESEDAGIIKVRQGETAYTAVCEHFVVLPTHTVREGPSACDISATVAGKSIPIGNREQDSNGHVVVTKVTVVQETAQFYRLVLRRYPEEDPSGGVYESFQVIPIHPKPIHPKPGPFIRPIYTTELG